MHIFVIGFILFFALYVAYEIHKERKRRGKSGIPILEYIFDSIVINVKMESDESESSGGASKSGGKKPINKKRRSKSPNKRSKKQKSRKSKNQERGSSLTAMEFNEQITQQSEKSDPERKRSKDLKEQ
uniref:Uncharacterized protein n=1 Tax=Panagrolaimus sp. PS1159 TaxID=55785 RepID=A0AC35F2L1_9BILA